MPLKRKPMPVLNSNILVIQPLNTLEFSTYKTTKSILVKFKPLSKF